MNDHKEMLLDLEQLKVQLEAIDRNEFVDLEKKLGIFARDLTSIEHKDIWEVTAGLDSLATELGSIEKKEYSFLKILGIQEDELVHSRFLAWLLDPSENHGLGPQFVKAFLEKAASKATNLDLSDVDFSSLLVEREVSKETSRLDIRLIDPSGHFGCVVENKISSKEGEKQTTRLFEDNRGIYPKELFIYLTLNRREEPEDTHFLPVAYGELLPMLNDLLEQSSDDTKYLIKNYLNTLERLIMSERFEGYSERTQLYFKFAKQIDNVKGAFEQDRKLILSTLADEIMRRKWWNNKVWKMDKTGSEVTVWKPRWYSEDKEKGIYMELRPSTEKPVIYASVQGSPADFSREFAPILKKHLEQIYPGKTAGDFYKNLTGVNTFLEKTLLFSFTEKDLIQKALANLDEMIDHFGEIIEKSVEEFSK